MTTCAVAGRLDLAARDDGSVPSINLHLQGPTSTVMARALRPAAIHAGVAGCKAAWTAAALRASQSPGSGDHGPVCSSGAPETGRSR